MLNSVLLFFDVSGGEIMVIMLFILMFFGSKKIPELARGLGKTMREFQNASNGLKQELLSETHKLREEVSTLRQDLQQKAGLDKITEEFNALNENVSKEMNLDSVMRQQQAPQVEKPIDTPKSEES